MFCPSCRDEFRAGFTRCARCNVDLVQELPAAGAGPQGSAPAPGPPPRVRLVDFCGFFSLTDARSARDRLREARIRCEIVLRDAPDAQPDGPVTEEAWIRVDPARLPDASRLLDEPEAAGAEPEAGAGDDDFACGDCGKAVAAEESFCPHCGARFEE